LRRSTAAILLALGVPLLALLGLVLFLRHTGQRLDQSDREVVAANRLVTGFMVLFGVTVAVGVPALSWWLQRLLGRVSGYYRAGWAAAERRAAELQITVTEKRAAEHRLRESERRLRFLNELSEATRPLLDPSEIMQVSTRLLGVHLGVAGCAYAEIGADGNSFSVPHYYAAHPTGRGTDDRLDRFGGALTGGLREGRTSRVANARAELPPESAAALAVSGVEALVSYPLLQNGALRAVLTVYEHKPRAWTDADVALLAEVGERCRAAVARARAETDLRSARDQAERASRAKDDFLASLSHELRTPLTPVLVTAAALREDERLSAEVRAQLGMMERNIALEARLIDDLLDLTTISRGRLKLRKQRCDVHSLIALALEIVQPEAAAKGIRIEPTFAAAHSGLSVDPARFQQVMWNLLRNAVKFTPPGGRIALSTREEAEPGGRIWLRIEVTDSGIGIDAALLNRIFLPFDQGALTGDHRFGGMGLGLAIARAVVDLHGGRITARSAGVNHGATFVVELPGAAAPPREDETPASPPGAEMAKPAALAPLRLLLVEDHESTLQALLRLLRRDGHQVAAAATAQAARAAAAHGSFDLVISDLGLPDGSGIELMGELRKIYGLRGIALSGYGMEGDLVRSRAVGFVAHLVKPVNIGELRKALTEIVAGGGTAAD